MKARLDDEDSSMADDAMMFSLSLKSFATLGNAPVWHLRGLFLRYYSAS